MTALQTLIKVKRKQKEVSFGEFDISHYGPVK
jgi:hypothetical protein